MNAKSYLLSVLAFILALSGCSKNQSGSTLSPEITQTKSFISLVADSVSPKVTTDIKIRKANLLGRTFLYGAALQTSSQINEEHERVPLFIGLNLGLVTAQFVIVDNRLRLQTDSRADFESDVNHPARLIQEFPILSQDEEFITFRADAASPAVDTFLFGDDNKVAKRSAWIRSLEFSEKDDLFLIQSSVELVDGSLAEFMETLTPREKLVPAEAKPIYNDEDLNPQAARYRFIGDSEVYLDLPEKGRVKAKIADRFLLKEGQTIDWYVTRNIPEKFIPDVKNGIEAWNRYTRAAGKADIVRFAGLLPEGVAIGDPRYNLVVWDNVAEADSAYETQSADPFTGVQMNSIIYLPSAWVSMGKGYWENMAETEDALAKREAALENTLKKKTFLGRRIPMNCLQSAHSHVSVRAIDSPEEFGRGLLKSTLFHEVGHSLGLDHNFKGSNSFDADAENPQHTDSIMDYNLYNEDSAAFTSLDSADGPVYEYDRQILSVLYNEGKDVLAADPELAACNDKEADSTDGGVDPFCQRYDLGKDPTKTALRSLELLEKQDARLGKMTSLPFALSRITTKLPAPDKATGQSEAEAALKKFATTVKSLVSIYLSSGGNSVAGFSANSLKALYVFRDDILPEGLSESEMRERSLNLLEKISGAATYPAATAASLAKVREAALGWLLTTPGLATLPENERTTKAAEWMKAYDKVFSGFEESAFSRLRLIFARSLKYSSTAPLSFHTRGSATVDIEKIVISTLENTASRSIGEKSRPMAERLEAIKTLATYRKVPEAIAAGRRLQESVAVEIRENTDARARESLRKLRDALEW